MIETSIWSDPKMQNLSRDAFDLMFYFMTAISSHLSGLYYIPIPLIVVHRRMEVAVIEKCIKELEKANLIKWDNDRQVVWVRKMFKRAPKGPKILSGVANHLATLHETPLIKDFLEHYSQFDIRYQYPTDRVPIAKPETAQDQEQDQDKDKKQEKSTNPPAKSSDPEEQEAKSVADAPGAKGKSSGSKKKNEKKPKEKKTDPRIKELIDYFFRQYNFLRDGDYVVAGGKDGKAIERLLKSLEPDEIRRRMLKYLEDNDPFLVRNGHPIAIFAERVNAYREGNGKTAKTDLNSRSRRITEMVARVSDAE